MPKIKNWSKKGSNTWFHDEKGFKVSSFKSPQNSKYKVGIQMNGGTKPIGKKEGYSSREKANDVAIKFMKNNPMP